MYLFEKNNQSIDQPHISIIFLDRMKTKFFGRINLDMSGISISKELISQTSSSLQINDEFNNHGIGNTPLANMYRLNLQSLLTDFANVEFSDSAWTYNPKLFCTDYYRDPDLFPIILLVNKLKSMFDFKATNLTNSLIKAPNADLIYHLLANR